MQIILFVFEVFLMRLISYWGHMYTVELKTTIVLKLQKCLKDHPKQKVPAAQLGVDALNCLWKSHAAVPSPLEPWDSQEMCLPSVLI